MLNNGDSGAGSLRAAIAAAHAGDTILFAPSVNDIVLTSGELAITQSLNIDGPGANHLTIARSSAAGTPSFRVFDVSGAGVNVSITGVTIANGLADGTLAPALLPGLGGGINNVYSKLTLVDVVLSENQAVGQAAVPLFGVDYGSSAGGGLDNLGGVVSVIDCTLTQNEAIGADGSSYGGGLGGAINNAQGNLTVIGSTLDHNQAQGGDNCSNGPFFPGLGAGGAIANDLPSGADLYPHRRR